MKISVYQIANAIHNSRSVRQCFPVSKRPTGGTGKRAEAAIEHFNSLTFEQKASFLRSVFQLADFAADVTDEIGMQDLDIEINQQ